MNQYDILANQYDSQTGKQLNDENLELELIERTGINNPNNWKILDVGCGSGIQHNFLLKRFPKITQIVGIDSSKNLIEIAKKNNKNEKFQYYVADMNLIPSPDETFDFVYSRYAIHYSDDLRKTFSEINRITKKGGLFYFQDTHPIFALFLKKSHDYRTKEQIEFTIQGGDIKVTHASFTFEEYAKSALENGWRIVSLEEYYGKRSEINDFRIPVAFSMKLQKDQTV